MVLPIDHEALKKKGFDDEIIAQVEKALPTSFEISNAFAPHVVGVRTEQSPVFQCLDLVARP